MTIKFKNNFKVNDCKVIYFNLLKDFCGFENVEILKMFNLIGEKRGILYSKIKLLQSAKFLAKKGVKQEMLQHYETVLQKAKEVEQKIKYQKNIKKDD